MEIDGPAGFLGDESAAYYAILDAFPLDKQNEILPRWEEGTPGKENDVMGFLAYTWTVFGNKVQGPVAAKELFARKQDAGEPFGEFFRDWQRLILDSGVSQWQDAPKVMLLRSALNTAMSEALVGSMIMPKTYTLATNFLIRVAANLEVTERWNR